MIRRSPALVMAALAFAGCGDSPTATGSSGPRFDLPVAGVMQGDWYLTNYPDAPGQGGINDYQCGPKSYDGHPGTDFVLRDFALMDQGLAVLAAAPGTVVEAHDGEFDRHKAWVPGATWNVVAVDHGAGYVAYYGHLKSGSVRVSEGDEVSAGQVLGEVGSSGRSDMAHLHFEVRTGYEDAADLARPTDPWEGPCGAEASLWASQIPYQDGFRVIQSGLTADPMTLDRAKDPPAQVSSVVGGQQGAISAWIQYHNQTPETVTVWRWLRPDGSLAAEVTRNHDSFYSMSWWWSTGSLLGLDTAGRWSVEIEADGELVARHFFQVTVAGAAPRAAARRLEVDGGGIR